DNILTSWQTENEKNVSRFEIEYSTDATSFVNGGTVAAENGASNNYQFTLIGFTQPLYYIRIKSVDIDGKIKYSSQAIVKKTDVYSKSIAVTPNPAVGNLTVHIVSEFATSCTISVINTAGAVIYQNKAELVRGDNQVYINTLSNVAKGSYIVQAIIGGQLLTKQIVIR
ncbi:MAG: T9SS type A sorting domain-containing protein, partial [Bacteroidota bacterium]